jgi:hypothetical protein
MGLFEKVIEPAAEDDICKLWKSVAPMARFFNAIWAVKYGSESKVFSSDEKIVWQLQSPDEYYTPTGQPFEVFPFPPTSGAISAGSMKIFANSFILQSLDATDTISLGGIGLDTPFELTTEEDGELQTGNIVYINIDVSPLYESTPGPATATIAQGTTWDGDGDSFFPVRARFNTTDGTIGSSAPANTKQSNFIVPIGFTQAATGINQNALQLTAQVEWVQVLQTNLRLGLFDCYKGVPVYCVIADSGPSTT